MYVSNENTAIVPWGLGGSGTNLLRNEILPSLGGLTKDSQIYALRYLHPMDEVLTGGVRIPDMTSDPSCALEGRSQWTIAANNTTTTYDVDIIIPPIPDIAFVYRTYVSGGTPSTWIPVSYSSYPSGYASSSLSAGNSTVTVVPKLRANADQYRATFSGITCHLVAAAINNAGMVFAGQYGSKISESGATSESYVGGVYNLDVPLDPNTLYQKTPGMVQQPARLGIYMPLMYRDTVNLYTNAPMADVASTSNAASGALTINWGQYVNVAPVPSGSYCSLYCAPVNMNTGVILFRGLDPHASVQVKTRLGLEVVPLSGSPWTPFVESSPVYDPVVLARSCSVRQRLALAYPASYNDFSSILRAIAGVLRGPIKGMASMIRKVPIPFLSDIAGTIDDVIA